MRRSKKILRSHFMARLKRQKENFLSVIKGKDTYISILRNDLENAHIQNTSLDVENGLLRERLEGLKKKKWYQFVTYNYNPNESSKEKDIYCHGKQECSVS